MGATIDERMDLAVFVAIDDDRRLADISRAEIAGVWDLDIEREQIPRPPAKDPLLLLLVQFGIVIEAIRHPAVIQRRPDIGSHHRSSPRLRGDHQGYDPRTNGGGTHDADADLRGRDTRGSPGDLGDR